MAESRSQTHRNSRPFRWNILLSTGSKQVFRRQLTVRTVVIDSATWSARIKRVALEIYRMPHEEVLPVTASTFASFASDKTLQTIAEEGEFVGGDVPPNRQDGATATPLASGFPNVCSNLAKSPSKFRIWKWSGWSAIGMTHT
ncbi:hypothetical protein V1508DRAFT_42953 [Lipomyces doorenjongii]|uniref:uncharacterized protein n=1 Tax=Lipomyces doorenjongii TaxID=383834 RepID=UPI0034CDC377